MEFRLRRADGQFRWLYDSGSPRFSSSGRFLGYIGSCIDITERKAAEQSLARLSGQLIRAREEECARIARELHDDLNQRMALVSVELEQFKQNPPETNAKLRKQIDGIMTQTVEISREIHRMSYDLHPSKLVHLGLVAAVNSMCDELSTRHGLKIEFSHEDLPATIPQDISLCLYRIVQECLNNVIRHSGAKKARIKLRGTGKEIRLRVSDSGSGFEIKSPRINKGLGLLSMRERLRLIGGTISIESRPSHGTRIDATVPLERTGQESEELSTNEKAQTAEG
jgi:signal transduction histidine kinase